MEEKNNVCPECGEEIGEEYYIDVNYIMHMVMCACEDISWTAPAPEPGNEKERQSAALLLAMGELACTWLCMNEPDETVN